MYKISIVTPTFNRGILLINLYESLKKQTFKEFEWIIVDDGSSDNTKNIVKNFIREGIINITYTYKKNGGKHTALNKAIDICESEMFYIVDSDDILVADALKKIVEFDKSLTNKEKFCGVSGLRSDFNGNILSGKMFKSSIDASSIDAIYKYKLHGDKSEVFYTNILKKYKFPEFNEEKFITEATVWNKMANDGYLIRWFNEVICIGEYREDGLTNDSLNLFLNNILGSLYYLNQESTFNIPIRYKIKHQANYFRYGLLRNKSLIKLIKKSNYKGAIIITMPLGFLGVFYTKIRYLIS